MQNDTLPTWNKKKAKRKSSIIAERSGVGKRKRGGGAVGARLILRQVALLMRLILTDCAPSRVNLLFAAFL